MKKGSMVLGLAAFAAALTFWSSCPVRAFETIEWNDTRLSVYGFLRNNTGMFLEDQPFAQNGNQLATARTWLRGNLDWRISDQLRVGAVSQFVYEPEYAVEDGAAGKPNGELSKPDGREYSEYDDVNDVLREVYFEWKPTKSDSIKIGRQIAIWGEALTERVGDVIHPEDGRFTLAFANLEDTRIPSYMIRGMNSFEGINSSIEWIFNPNLVDPEYRVNRVAQWALPTLGEAGQRFAIDPGVFRFLPPFVVNQLHEEFPDTGDLRYGVRTSTFLGGYQFGISYFHTQEYNRVLRTTDFALIHPDEDIFGVYMNKNLPWPGVVRAEGIYVPNKPINTLDPTVEGGYVRRDYIKYALAYDLNSFLYFPWHNTAPFDVTFEHVGEWVPDNHDIEYFIYDTEIREWNPKFNMRISTNWLYNLISTELVASYLPWGNSGLIMPAVKYTPPWLNQKLSLELKYINVFGDNNSEGLGILRSKDMIVLTTQFDW